MLNCVTSKLLLNYHGRPPSSFNNLRECVTLFTCKSDFGTSSSLQIYKDEKPKKWLLYNNVVYPPQEPGEERRPAVC